MRAACPTYTWMPARASSFWRHTRAGVVERRAQQGRERSRCMHAMLENSRGQGDAGSALTLTLTVHALQVLPLPGQHAVIATRHARLGRGGWPAAGHASLARGAEAPHHRLPALRPAGLQLPCCQQGAEPRPGPLPRGRRARRCGAWRQLCRPAACAAGQDARCLAACRAVTLHKGACIGCAAYSASTCC